jgi:hypothetical protein
MFREHTSLPYLLLLSSPTHPPFFCPLKNGNNYKKLNLYNATPEDVLVNRNIYI